MCCMCDLSKRLVTVTINCDKSMRLVPWCVPILTVTSGHRLACVKASASFFCTFTAGDWESKLFPRSGCATVTSTKSRAENACYADKFYFVF